MKVPQWKLINVTLVKGAPYNPASRTEEKNLRDLADSMETIGLIYPVVVDRDNVLIEGHRRTAAAKLLGWETIAAIVVEGDRDQLYADLNSTAKRLSGTQKLEVFMREKHAVSKKDAQRFQEMEKVLGRVCMAKILEAGFSFRLFTAARRVARYCEFEDVKAIVEWMLCHRVMRVVEAAMAACESPVTIVKAIRSNRAIKFQLGTA